MSARGKHADSSQTSAEPSSSISVVMAVFNGERFLGQQLDSIRSQTRRPAELVIVDDASTDGSRGIIDRFVHVAPFPVKIVENQTNQGSTSAFERGLLAMTGDMVALADQDDVWQSSKLAILADRLERNAAATLTFSDASLIDEAGSPLPGTLWKAKLHTPIRKIRRDPFAVLLRANVVTGATALFRRSVIEAGAPFPRGMTLYHDSWLAVVGSALGSVIPEPRKLTTYRVHPAQQIGVGRQSARRVDMTLQPTTGFSHALARMRSVEEWLEIARLPDSRRAELLREAGDFREHIALRTGLPPERTRRVAPVSKELATGGYRKWSNGLRSAVKDLLSHGSAQLPDRVPS